MWGRNLQNYPNMSRPKPLFDELAEMVDNYSSQDFRNQMVEREGVEWRGALAELLSASQVIMRPGFEPR